MRTPVVLGIVLLLGAAAHAQPTGRITGTVKVTEADGKPAANAHAIVYVVGFSEPPTKAVTQINQQGRKFSPDLVAITVGETVTFPNRDPFLHNVFSQSPPRKFDLGSFKKDESKDRLFPELGVVDVYCNIHPEMAATILVLPNRHHAEVGADGTFTLDGLPPGDWTVFAYTRRAAKPISARVSIKGGAEATVELTLVRNGEDANHKNKYGEKYHDAGGTYR
jgi:plastocyanin